MGASKVIGGKPMLAVRSLSSKSKSNKFEVEYLINDLQREKLTMGGEKNDLQKLGVQDSSCCGWPRRRCRRYRVVVRQEVRSPAWAGRRLRGVK